MQANRVEKTTTYVSAFGVRQVHKYRRMSRGWTLSAALVLASPVHAHPPVSLNEAPCMESAARYYSLPVALLRAIRAQEGGTAGAWSLNTDGSVDYGVMQINSRWLPRLEQRGYTARALVYDACASIVAGAWILAHAMAERGAWNRSGVNPTVYWQAIGNYHSHTPQRNRAYAEKVWARYLREVGP
jgi:soluble lytic murein transglycosylase-like protein